MTALQELVRAVIVHGLRLSPSELTPGELDEQARYVRMLLEDGHSYDSLMNAIQHGMQHHWKFKDGSAWGARELRENITAAKGNAGRLRRAKLIPYNPQTMEGP